MSSSHSSPISVKDDTSLQRSSNGFEVRINNEKERMTEFDRYIDLYPGRKPRSVVQSVTLLNSRKTILVNIAVDPAEVWDDHWNDRESAIALFIRMRGTFVETILFWRPNGPLSVRRGGKLKLEGEIRCSQRRTWVFKSKMSFQILRCGKICPLYCSFKANQLCRFSRGLESPLRPEE